MTKYFPIPRANVTTQAVFVKISARESGNSNDSGGGDGESSREEKRNGARKESALSQEEMSPRLEQSPI